jgi:hypothetical protein
VHTEVLRQLRSFGHAMVVVFGAQSTQNLHGRWYRTSEIHKNSEAGSKRVGARRARQSTREHAASLLPYCDAVRLERSVFNGPRIALLRRQL